ncbi:MAG: methylenetetrahydrofolate reductase [NAD(P)H] [Bacteroidaceae bacterium]|nr:methylenetetrahydrofolate reductase [NAD(P)H] [Bacteroidaceae bacterium]
MSNNKPDFSFEILPPLKGNSIKRVYDIIDKLQEFNPKYVNITSHHSEYEYRPMPDGSHRKVVIRKRPGTVAVAAAIQYKYGIKAVPHIICKGFTKEETEYALLDLNFLGINNVFLLRGDSKGGETPKDERGTSHEHATDLQQQVNLFNQGIGLDGSRIEGIETPFVYGMACYPEKHEEAPNMQADIRYAKMKVDNGASYLVTQMFFDNSKYFSFVEQCRQAGITVPIIPGIKPIVFMNQLNVLPRVFRVDLPEPLAQEVAKCTTNEQVKQVGIEWGINQCKELIAAGVPALHFYTLFAANEVREIAKAVF